MALFLLLRQTFWNDLLCWVSQPISGWQCSRLISFFGNIIFPEEQKKEIVMIDMSPDVRNLGAWIHTRVRWGLDQLLEVWLGREPVWWHFSVKEVPGLWMVIICSAQQSSETLQGWIKKKIHLINLWLPLYCLMKTNRQLINRLWEGPSILLAPSHCEDILSC